MNPLSLPHPPNMRYCALCECPLPIDASEEVCGACVREWQAWGELLQDIQTGMRTDWPVKGISHAKMQRQRGGPIGRHWEFVVSEINDSVNWDSSDEEGTR